MILFALFRLAAWIARHVAHIAARTWDVIAAAILAIVCFMIAVLAWIILPRTRP